jgi:hypothetical protein
MVAVASAVATAAEGAGTSDLGLCSRCSGEFVQSRAGPCAGFLSPARE